MANAFNSEVGQANKTDGSGKALHKRTSAPGTSDPKQSTANWPGLPGKTGPSRGSAPKIKEHAKAVGI